MITPRATRLLRVADLAAFRTTLAALACDGQPFDARDRVIVVPTRAAAALARATFESSALGERDAMLQPELVVPAELPATLARRARPGLFEARAEVREVLMDLAARAAVDGGVVPPFRLRPGLVAEMVRFYDMLGRNGRSVDVFERITTGRLEPGAEYDRGAGRLLKQTHFLVAAFREFERLRAAHEWLDEHGLRRVVIEHAAARPWRHVVVTVGDTARDPYGLCQADWDMLTRVPGLERLDLLTTDRTLAGAWHERVHQLLPGIEEVRVEAEAGVAPVLRVPRAVADAGTTTGHPRVGPQVWDVRDREEEVADFARWVRELVRADQTVPLERMALVVRQPLPYAYLARDVLRASAVPYQTFDTLPLAGEPHAAALDLVVSAVSTNLSRATALALLMSPHFRFLHEGRPVSPGSMAAADAVLSERGYLGGLDALRRLVQSAVDQASSESRLARALPALHALVAVAEGLEAFRLPAPVARHLELLLAWLDEYEAAPGGDDAFRARTLRARAAVRGILVSLRDAYHDLDPAPVDFERVVVLIRRWIETHTFAPRIGEGGVHIVDAESARFGAFDHVQISGLVDGEWPERPRRNVFYGPAILRDLGWSAESEQADHVRDSFADLLRLPAATLTVTTFGLEDDAVVAPSPLLDELERAAHTHQEAVRSDVRIFDAELLGIEPVVLPGLDALVQTAAEARLARTPRTGARHRGMTTGHTVTAHSLSALERYLDCPFKYFAHQVLRLEEVPQDEPFLSPRARGRFIHEVFERFFKAWDGKGLGTITADRLTDARQLFQEVAEPLLATLSPSDAELERARLFGSAIAVGVVDVVLGLEASRPAAVRERWLEQSFEGVYTLGVDDGRRVPIRGIADRVDLLEGNVLRVFDYKSGSAPEGKRALQVPIYALCAQERVEQRDGRAWTVGEAAYVAFSGKRTLVPIVESEDEAGPVLLAARERLFEVVDAVESGVFPPRPHDIMRCRWCAYPAVCRKDYVDE